jgi:carboxylate-amine ligase
MEELLEILDDVVDELDCRREVEYINTIMIEGTSADRQIAVYEAAGGDENRTEALIAIVDSLIGETQEGL